jgi:hypothetical protein
LTGEAAEKVVTVDWDTVDISDKTDLVIAPISDIDMAKLFGISVDDRDKENESDATVDDGNRHARQEGQDDEEDIDPELMENATVDVDDAHDDELVCVYDKQKTELLK